YMASLTGKPRPKICYLPTASADSPNGIITFYQNCAPLEVEPYVQESFIASTEQSKGWDEVFLSMDGIVCSGGNTLNQQAIW
ncbi:Type 1 glutamine amidotransferase-like domain-containing protein, partial [Salmonella sp. SAL4431]|uniref:Type 1 glutamine amidotransferase-like domain-containing protein n=1 Tax=Salmonella sp. SAL4431 TaxID=3159886 RepID=UPI00397CCD1F